MTGNTVWSDVAREFPNCCCELLYSVIHFTNNKSHLTNRMVPPPCGWLWTTKVPEIVFLRWQICDQRPACRATSTSAELLVLMSDKVLPKHSTPRRVYISGLFGSFGYSRPTVGSIDYWPYWVSGFVHRGALFDVKWICETELRLREHGVVCRSPSVVDRGTKWQWDGMSDPICRLNSIRTHAINTRLVAARHVQLNNAVIRLPSSE